MQDILIYQVPGFVTIKWASDLQAVSLKWKDEFHEGTRLKDAVLAAVDYVCKNGVENWYSDLSTSVRGPSPADVAWLNSEDFKRAFRRSPLGKFALMPPLPETGQDLSWIHSWEENTMATMGNQIEALLSTDYEEIRAFLRG